MNRIDNFSIRVKFTVSLETQIPSAYTQDKREITEQTRLTEDLFWILGRIPHNI